MEFSMDAGKLVIEPKDEHERKILATFFATLDGGHSDTRISADYYSSILEVVR